MTVQNIFETIAVVADFLISPKNLLNLCIIPRIDNAFAPSAPPLTPPLVCIDFRYKIYQSRLNKIWIKQERIDFVPWLWWHGWMNLKHEWEVWIWEMNLRNENLEFEKVNLKLSLRELKTEVWWTSRLTWKDRQTWSLK